MIGATGLTPTWNGSSSPGGLRNLPRGMIRNLAAIKSRNGVTRCSMMMWWSSKALPVVGTRMSHDPFEQVSSASAVM